MTRDEAIALLRRHADPLRARGVRHIALIGSLARGGERSESDIDLLVEIEPGRRFSLLHHSGLRLYVSDLLDCDTDVIVRSGLDQARLARVERDAIAVF